MIDILGCFRKSHGGQSWYAFRRSRGDAPMTCLGIIIATIALGVWAYYHFWHNRALERAGEDITIAKQSDTQSINSYRFRVRDRLMPAVERVNKNVRKAVFPIYKNKVTNQEEALSALLKCEEEQRDLIGDINEAIAPSKFSTMHKNMAVSVGCNWSALCKAREALKCDNKRERDILIKASKKELSKGNKACEAAKMDSQRMFK